MGKESSSNFFKALFFVYRGITLISVLYSTINLPSTCDLFFDAKYGKYKPVRSIVIDVTNGLGRILTANSLAFA